MSVASELTVITFFEGVVEIGGGVDLAVIFDLFITLQLDDLTIFKRELIAGLFQVTVFNQYALEASGLKRKVVQPFRP